MIGTLLQTCINIDFIRKMDEHILLGGAVVYPSYILWSTMCEDIASL